MRVSYIVYNIKNGPRRVRRYRGYEGMVVALHDLRSRPDVKYVQGAATKWERKHLYHGVWLDDGRFLDDMVWPPRSLFHSPRRNKNRCIL